MPPRKGRTRKSTSRSRAPKDAIALLKADHKEVKAMVQQFNSSRSDSKKAQLAEQICAALEVHAEIEEELFYPPAREALKKNGDLIDEAEVEHTSVKELIAKIKGGSPGDDLWEAQVKVLGEYVNHHVKEEEGEIFPKVKKTRLDLQALGEQLAQRKAELQGGEA
ncbi:MAG TPA: hemerythrin domain-containing protein [Rhizomicrobium sp.]|jgi:hemerythrin superfamily protein|nr:hemerythrin domain-containing protein [Rhizomicrobium sp.]